MYENADTYINRRHKQTQCSQQNKEKQIELVFFFIECANMHVCATTLPNTIHVCEKQKNTKMLLKLTDMFIQNKESFICER